jgi:hypothetical protein
MPRGTSKDQQFVPSSIKRDIPIRGASEIRPYSSAKPSPTIRSYLFSYYSYERRKATISMRGCAKSSKTPREEDRDEIRAYFRSPTWLINRAWEIEGRKALSGWDFNVLTYNFVSATSLIFIYAQIGTIAQLQELFQNRLASPLDTDEYGQTVLHVSCTTYILKILFYCD